MSGTAWGIRCVWLRYFAIFRKNLLYGLVTTYVEPILYLVSFGFGLGGIIGDLTVGGETISYRRFILAGLVGQGVLFQGFFETAFGGFVRMYYQRIFKAMAITPITLSEVLWAELLWGASKSTFSCTSVLLIGTLLGDFTVGGALLALPVCFVASLLFAALGLWVSAVSYNIEQISYPQYLLVFPMFLFCGVYFPLEKMPEAAQLIAWCLPLTSILAMLRAILLGFALPPQAIPIALGWLVGLVTLSRWQMTRRLVR